MYLYFCDFSDGIRTPAPPPPLDSRKILVIILIYEFAKYTTISHTGPNKFHEQCSDELLVPVVYGTEI